MSKENWDSLAPIYEMFMKLDDKVYKKMYNYIRSAIQNKIVLEVCTGTGIVARNVASASERMLATDFSEKMLKEAVELGRPANLDYEIADVEDLPYIDSCFDVVIIANALNYMKNPEKVLQEIHRVLKVGGIMIAPCFLNDHMAKGQSAVFRTYSKVASMEDQRKWSQEEYLRFLTENGWKLRKGMEIKSTFPLTYVECRFAGEEPGESEKEVMRIEQKKSPQISAGPQKTLRLVFPQWQGGMNPAYMSGAEILAATMPKGRDCAEIRVPVQAVPETPAENVYGEIEESRALKAQLRCAAEILKEQNPDRVITFGGDCSVSQTSFDYLHGKYPENTGILWIDAHPDISTPKDLTHEHAMVLGNLTGAGAPEFAAMTEHPFEPSQVMYAGLITDGLEEHEKPVVNTMKEQGTVIAEPEDIRSGRPVSEWIQSRRIQHLLVHLDLDVLTPGDFRSLLCNEPGKPPVEYAVGKLKFREVMDILSEISDKTQIVGLTVAEYLPWDLIRMQEAFGKLDIFK